MDVTVSSISRESIKAVVEGVRNGAIIDPSAYPVSWAFKPAGVAPDPTLTGPPEWAPGSWEQSGTRWEAVCLVGRGSSAPLDPGTYVQWVRIVTSAEDVIEPLPDRLVVT